MLYNFLVLGYIPGTNVQLSFADTLALIIFLMGAMLVGWVEWRQYLIRLDEFVTRRPLHASQLHLRAQ